MLFYLGSPFSQWDQQISGDGKSPLLGPFLPSNQHTGQVAHACRSFGYIDILYMCPHCNVLI